MGERRTKPKLAVGDTVTYRGNRRLRRKVTDRYWDANYPGWRYRLNEKGLRKDLAACWAVIEHELILIKAAP
jgi:hypothetical protein